MAFDATKMIKAVESGTQRMYLYRTADSRATVAGTGYFNAWIGILNVGDLIFCTYDTGGTPITEICTITSITTNVAFTATMYTT